MSFFYWFMGVAIVGTLIPSIFYWVLYAMTGERACMSRAQVLWNVSRVFSLAGFNLLIWGHVAVGLFGMWFR